MPSSVYMRTPLRRNTIRIPPERVNTRSAKRAIKKDRKLKAQERKRIELESDRHREFEIDNEVYNCATSCNVIKVKRDDCDHQVFEALCYKTAICLRDFIMRIRTSNIDESEIHNDETAIYKRAAIKNKKIVLDNKKTRHAFFCLDDYPDWIKIKHQLTSNNLTTQLYGQYWINESNLAQYRTRRGVWVKIQNIHVITDTKEKLMSTDGLFLGPNFSSHHKKMFDIIGQKTFPSWKLPMENIIACLHQVKYAAKICKITNENVNNVRPIIHNIFTDEIFTHTIRWERLADTFFGGLSKFSHHRNLNIYNALDWLKEIHYVKGKKVREILEAYQQGLNMKSVSKNQIKK